MSILLKKLGPGFLFAGAAIGVSHLVQSTRAGADFGFGLLWALVLINLIKYPFFQFGTSYAAATGESMLEGYHKMGKGVLIAYFILTFATMFTIQTAVTIVTAGIAASLFGWGAITLWTAVITAICFCILILGKYKFLDGLIKGIVICLTISTIIAVALIVKDVDSISLQQTLPSDVISIGFLIAFMGWMPAPLDISIWQSIWTIEKQKIQPDLTPKQVLFDFNVGYVMTCILALGFLALGALVMFDSGESFSNKGGVFANQLINIYVLSLGDWAKIIIGIAALTTMFSTTLTTLDASPRVMHKTSEILSSTKMRHGYLLWLVILAIGTLFIFKFLLSEMGSLIKIATILSFLTAPFYAIINLKLMTSQWVPAIFRPSRTMRIYAGTSIGLLFALSIWYLSTLL
ncbi:NRAMP family divalent metal transporter [Patiriisocius sp. Uisw_047]|jgi:Mn2+/Fe2+ NRAMP family transporter|uniref:NRAMP family divalent metal transporter n=1 Tax=Patiriisocius sp. Uisw_047 TaxID=3230969 RepID=UPI0039E882D5